MMKLLLTVAAAVTAFAASLGVALAYEGGAEKDAIPDNAAGWEHLYNEMLIDITAIGVFFAIVTLYFMIKYRRKNDSQVGTAKKLSKAQAIGWAVIPAFLFFADDLYLAAKSWELWDDIRTPPANSYEIKLEAAMYSWTFNYPNGVETYTDLVVPVGTPILLRMTATDVIHAYYLPDFKIKEDIMPGRYTYQWFYPQKVGEYVATCAEFCGVGHSDMYGKLIVKTQEDFDKWMAKEVAEL